MVGSKAVTLEGMVKAGIVGRIQTRAEADVGPLFGGGGNAVAPALKGHDPTPAPDPTDSVSEAAVARSETPATGRGPCVESSAETGSTQARSSASATVTGSRQ